MIRTSTNHNQEWGAPSGHHQVFRGFQLFARILEQSLASCTIKMNSYPLLPVFSRKTNRTKHFHKKYFPSKSPNKTLYFKNPRSCIGSSKANPGVVNFNLVTLNKTIDTTQFQQHAVIKWINSPVSPELYLASS